LNDAIRPEVGSIRPKIPTTGELKGVAVDLGRELARRVGAPFQPVLYPSPAAIIVGAKSGEWDVALMGINAERAAVMDFSAPYMEVEQGYLVHAGVPTATSPRSKGWASAV
jgi:polar amino acid transport system substrate-binding protein